MTSFLLHSYNLVCRRNGRALFAPVRLALVAGEAVHLKGPNGSGKTSLLRALAGLLHFEGRIEKGAAHSYIGHRDAVQNELTVCEHLKFWQGLAQYRRVIFFDDVIDNAGLQGLENRRASTLSEGQRQRLALCRLLIEDAPIWLLDEPSSALDADGHNFFASLLAKHTSQGGAALIASHSETIPNTTLFHLMRAAA